MDLLQEINNKLRGEYDRVWNKIHTLLYDSTLGIVKQYKDKALELVKITGMSVYLHALRITRKHLVLLSLIFFGTMVSAVAAVVIPVALVILAPWNYAIKAVCLLMLGSLYIGGTAWVFLTLFSEDKWLKISGVQDFLDSLYNQDTSSRL